MAPAVAQQAQPPVLLISRCQDLDSGAPLLSQHSSELHGELAREKSPDSGHADMRGGQAWHRHSLSSSIFQRLLPTSFHTGPEA